MWKSFSDFILDLHSLDEGAARWLAEECIKAENLEKNQINWGRTPISKWENNLDLDLLLLWDNTPQEHRYWSKLHRSMEKKWREGNE